MYSLFNGVHAQCIDLNIIRSSFKFKSIFFWNCPYITNSKVYLSEIVLIIRSSFKFSAHPSSLSFIIVLPFLQLSHQNHWPHTLTFDLTLSPSHLLFTYHEDNIAQQEAQRFVGKLPSLFPSLGGRILGSLWEEINSDFGVLMFLKLYK